MEPKLTPVLKTLLAVAKKFEKAYCYPSQARLLLLLRKYHKLRISRRTLNRYLRTLEGEHFFTRVRRHRQGKNGKMIFASTLYKLGGRAFNWIHDLGTMSASFFTFFHVPKLAQYKSSSARYGSHSGQLDRLRAMLSQKGGFASSSSCGLSPPPDPAK
jgi:hypothetical protein